MTRLEAAFCRSGKRTTCNKSGRKANSEYQGRDVITELGSSSSRIWGVEEGSEVGRRGIHIIELVVCLTRPGVVDVDSTTSA
jgi:hypothetical protein